MISGVFKFFLEAKAAMVPLGGKEAKQSVDYAYYKSVPWAVLTNFGELVVYVAVRKYGDESRFLRFGMDEYVPRFGELALLGREAFLADEIDKYAERVGKKLNPEPVNRALFRRSDGMAKNPFRQHNGAQQAQQTDKGGS